MFLKEYSCTAQAGYFLHVSVDVSVYIHSYNRFIEACKCVLLLDRLSERITFIKRSESLNMPIVTLPLC